MTLSFRTWAEGTLARVQCSPDVVLAAGLAAMLGLMIVPIPAGLLDFLLALNLAMATTLMVSALLAKEPLKVASFPTLLLLTTLFRLGLNVSSTRLALTEGYAGQVIETFGELLTRGDYVVGLVVFGILTLVQFLVVAKGAERVAEVSARFSLDGMPGKQMAIDADLRAGLLDAEGAALRRRRVERESQLFGAMDGAMKFVKGDVIAGLVIVVIHLVGGTLVGVFQQGQSWAEAAQSYALLAIGDGLVSQIPSLFITVAAGLVVTRVVSEDAESSLSRDLGEQFFGRSTALFVAGALSWVLALLPGMPGLIFAVLGTVMVFGAWKLARAPAPPEALPAKLSPPWVPHVLGETSLALELSDDLGGLVDEVEGRGLGPVLGRVRQRLYDELGIHVCTIRARICSDLELGAFRLCWDGLPASTGIADAESLYAHADLEQLKGLKLPAQLMVSPTPGKTLCQVSVKARAALDAARISFWTAEELIGEHWLSLLRQRAAALLGIQELQKLLQDLEAIAPYLVKEVHHKIPLPLLTEVFRRLLSEHVSIRNLRLLLETLASPATEGDVDALTDRCRQAMSRFFTHKYAPHGPLYAYLVDPHVEQWLRQETAACDPAQVSELLRGVGAIARGKENAVVLTAPDVRRKLRKLCEGTAPSLAVLTYSELEPELQIRPLGKISMGGGP